MHTLTRFTMAAITAAALVPLLSLQAQAQVPRARAAKASRITLAVVDSMPVATAKAMLVRKANGATLLVLDRRHATPETLGLGLAVLRRAERTTLEPGGQQVIPIQGGVPTVTPSARRMAFLRDRIAEVGARPHGALGALGRGKFIEFADERSAQR